MKVGGRYALGAARIEVDSIEVVPFSGVTRADVRRAGEKDREALRRREHIEADGDERVRDRYRREAHQDHTPVVP